MPANIFASTCQDHIVVVAMMALSLIEMAENAMVHLCFFVINQLPVLITRH